ncbi:MAG TPA: ATP-dependent Clp protease adapter ClpS [Opitutaceae bacterium]|nr:ATP-dependent Clp protease adapter ClpS [Opitutaceae bacterium]
MSVAAPKTKRKTATRKKTVPQPTTPWLVVVHNDPVNLMSYVVLVFKKVLGFTEAKARKHMLEVHKKGRSVVWSGERERAEAYAQTLQTWQLSARIEHSSDGK